MSKKSVLFAFLFAILLMSVATAQVPDIGKSGCVTYEQARAQGVKGTDAELRSMGFCAGTATQTATETTTQNLPKNAGITETSSSSALKSYQTAGLTNEQLFEVASASNAEMFDIINSIRESAGDSFDYDAANAVYDRYSEASSDYMNNVYLAAHQKALDERDKCNVGCENKAGINRQESEGDYDLWRSCRDECTKNLEEADTAAYRSYVDLVIQNNRKIVEETAALAGQQIDGGSGRIGDLPKGPEFNKNDNRGRTPQGLIAPSMGGYLGNAYVQRADGTKVIPGKELYLNVYDKVMTGEESKVNILFGNAGRMHLGPNTVLRVGNALLDQYYLAKGTLKTKLDWTAGAKLRIDTINAAIFVKGTEFVTEYDETTNTTKISLKEGTLEISSPKENISLTAGNYGTISPDGTIVSGPLDAADWVSLGGNFYEEPNDEFVSEANNAYAFVTNLVTFAVLILSVISMNVFVYREKKKPQKNVFGKNLGVRSILFGILGIIIGMPAPIIGIPLAFASVTMARIQNLRASTLSAKIGYVIGFFGTITNTVLFLVHAGII